MPAKYKIALIVLADLCAILVGCDAERLPSNSSASAEKAPFEVKVSLIHDQLQGHYADVSISADSARGRLSGYDLFLSYDPNALTFISALPGELLKAEGWDLFDSQVYSGSQVDGSPLNFVHLYAIKDVPNVEHQPDDSLAPSNELATLQFYVTNDRYYECNFLPIRFYWRNCDDNVLSLLNGDTIAFVSAVYDTARSVAVADTIDIDGWHGPSEDCFAALHHVPVPMIDFINGSIGIVCGDSIDSRGDINYNGLAFEIADAIMYTNYFVNGLSAFGSHTDASTAASDVNTDGNTLTVADLVYLIRIIQGDALPSPPVSDTASLAISSNYHAHTVTVSTESDSTIGAMYMVFDATEMTGPPSLGPGTDWMDMKYNTVNDSLRILIFNIGSHHIAPGTQTVLTIPASGAMPLLYAEAATYSGIPMKSTIDGVPQQFELGQNYPNPFSTSTIIPLALPVESDWSVYIFNVAADTVRTYSGHSDAGVVTIEWNGTWQDGTPAANGVYFYRAIVGDLTATRKMTLVR